LKLTLLKEIFVKISKTWENIISFILQDFQRSSTFISDSWGKLLNHLIQLCNYKVYSMLEDC
jgi:hypothetical protein